MLRDRKFLRDTGVLFLALVISGILHYVYQLYIGRALGPEVYGIFGSLFPYSMFSQS